MLEKTRAAMARWISPSKSEVQTKSVDESIASGFSVLDRGTASPRKGSSEILNSYAAIPQLVRIFGRIASSSAGTPFVTYKLVDEQGKVQRSKKLERAGYSARRGVVQKLARSGRVLEEIENDPLIDFLEEGNTALTGFECREIMQLHLELVGECFAVKERNSAGMPIRYWPILPTWIRDVPGISKDYYELQINSRTQKVDRSEMIHIRTPNPALPYGRGAGIAASLSDELATDEYAAEYLRTFFYNNAMPSSIVSVRDADRTQLRRLEKHWERRNRGTDKAHRTTFVNGDVEVSTLTADMGHLSMTELRQFLADSIRMTPGVPPEIVGQIENSNRATIQAANYIFARWVLVPRLDRWCMALQKQVVPDFDSRNLKTKNVRIMGYESPVPEDRDYILEVASAAPWSRTRAEWRELQGLGPNDYDDVYLQEPGLTERPIDEEAPLPSLPEPAKSEGGEIVQKASTVDPDLPTTLAELARADTLEIETRSLWSEQLQSWGTRTLEDLGLSASFNMLNPRTVQHLDEFGATRVRRINETTQKAIREAVTAGVQAGEGYEKIAKRVKAVFTDATTRRAVTIARTEPAISANWATWQAHKQSGLVKKREWIATRDGRTRDQHLAMDGVVVGIDAAFTLPDTTEAVAPGQSGIASHDINCRCTTVAVVDEERSTRTEAERDLIWKTFDEDLIGWEGLAERAFRRAFQEQEQVIMGELRRLAALRGESI